MVAAKLHVICGNCGSGDSFEWSHDAGQIDAGEIVQVPTVYLRCTDCCTLHDLNDNTEEAKNE